MSAAEVAPGVRRVPGESLMRGNLYAESTYLRTEPARGVTRTRMGTRMCALTADFLHGFRRAITDECGPAADTVFRSIGRKWGVLYARRFKKEVSEFYGKPLDEFSMALFQACLVEMFSHHGWGKVSLDLSRHTQGLFVVETAEPLFASLVERADRPVDTLMTGILAGFFSEISGQELDCVQTRCKACGAPVSSFVLGLTARLGSAAAWVGEGVSHEDILRKLESIRM
jgi:predicted hydrocarbon binding protein